MVNIINNLCQIIFTSCIVMLTSCGMKLETISKDKCYPVLYILHI